MNRRMVNQRSTEHLLSALVVSTLLISTALTAQATSGPTRITIAAPDLISPANGAETTGNPADLGRLLYQPLGIPPFEWEDVGASKYELEVASTEAFGASVVLKLSDLQYAAFTPNGDGETSPGFSLTEGPSGEFSDQATFYWHVRAWDDDLDEWSSWSPTWSFVRHWGYTPELLGPEDGSIHSQTPYFEWEPVPGASFYQIQVDSSEAFGALLLNETVDVPVFTPVNTLANDTDLFWRVRTFHRPASGSTTGGYGGPWSEVRVFQLAWSSKIGTEDKRPLQLTPPNNANYINTPLFCWQPVAGANKYEIDVADHPEFVAGSFVVDGKQTEGTCYVFEKNGKLDLEFDTPYYWRVTALDARGLPGQRTDTGAGSAAFAFRTTPGRSIPPTDYEPPLVPDLLYPPYYYTPITSDTFDDPTVAMPTFVWDHVEGATEYELRLDDDPAMADPPTAIITTANASFTFTDTDTYPLNDGQVYYWKVRAVGVPGSPNWNQMLNKWKVRVDRGRAEITDTVQLIQPTYQGEPWTGFYKYGQEIVTYDPVFAWTAVAPIGDATYQIQIAHDSAFESIAHQAQTDFVEYTPIERPEPGTYFWRVRRVAPTPGSWSETGRFIVSRNFTYYSISVDGDPSEWGAVPNAWYSPPLESGDASDPVYDMTGIYIANDSYNWYFGIALPPTATLGLYLDINHFDQSGAAAPPAGEGQDPQPPEAHWPEYALYLGGNDLDGRAYKWAGSAWEYSGPLFNIGASAAYSATSQVLELAIPVTAIDQPDSLSLMLFTMDDSDVIQDRLPNQPDQPTQAAFLTESTAPTPLFPANAPSNPALAKIEHNTPVLTWRHNEAGMSGTFFYQTFQDDTLTNLYESENANAPYADGWNWLFNTYWAPKVHYSDNNSYHWTIQRGGFDESAPIHFRKAGYLPSNLQFSPLIVSGTMTYTNRTPSFSWQPAQSAPKYLWELYEGGVRRQDEETLVPYYTPQDAVADGAYTWKVWSKDPRGRLTAEAAQGEFRKVSDVVPVMAPEYGERTLVLRWQPVDFAARYRVEIADDPQFSRDFKSYTTYNTVFTPRQVPAAVEDGSFYWRVYTLDNRDHPGPTIDLRFGLLVYLPFVIR